MSTTRGGSTAGRGRGRGRGGSLVGGSANSSTTVDAPAELSNLDFSAPVSGGSGMSDTQPSKQRRAPAKSADELRRVMDIIQSRISVIIDSLEGDDNEASLKRNVTTAVKHLKQINVLLN